MNKLLISLIVILFAIMEIIAVVLGSNNGSIVINKDVYMMLIGIGVAVILCVIIALIRFALYPRLKYKNIFRLLKENNGDEIIKELKNLTLTSNNTDQYLILSVISNREVFLDPIFFELANKLTNNMYIFAKHFWLTIKSFQQNENAIFKSELQNYKESPRSALNTKVYKRIMNYLEIGNEEDYLYLKNKINNIVLLEVINQKHNV